MIHAESPTNSLTTEIPPGARALHLVLLFGVGVAQPLYELLGRNPSFFVAHSATTIDLILFVGLVSLAIPAVLWTVQWVLTRVADTFGSVVYLASVSALFAVIAMVPLKRLFPAAGMVVVAVAVGIAFAATFAYTRFSALRSVMSLLSPSALLFPILLLFFSGVTEIMESGREAPVETTTGARPTPVVLIVFDEVPVTSLMNQDRLVDSVAFPNFAEFAAHSHWFRNATTVAQNTSYAVPAILTGRFPDETRAPHGAAYPENVFSLLAGSHELRAVEIFTRLCPDEINAALVEREPLVQRLKAVVVDSSVVLLHIVLPAPLVADLPAIDSTWRDFGNESKETQAEDPHARSHDSTWVAERFLRNLTATRRPTFFFLHLNLPHLPWKYLPSGLEYALPGAPLRPHGLQGEMWGSQDWEVIQGWQRHLLQLGYADRLLGRFIDRFRRTGLWDDALIIVTADHGVSFQTDRSRRRATAETAADVMGVPLLVKLPGLAEPEIHDTDAQTIDILATIADVLDADVPWAIDGRSLFAEETVESDIQVVYRNKGANLDGSFEVPNRPEAKYRTLERRLEIFPAGKPIENLFAIGDFGKLVDRRASDLDAAPESQISLTLNDPWIFDDVDLGGPFVPAHITGHLTTQAPFDQPVNLAIAVNGMIGATTTTYSLPGENDFSSFSALVSESTFTSGRNLVAVYLINEVGDGDPRLMPVLPGATISYSLRLHEDGNQDTILSSDGRTIEVKPGAIRVELKRKGDSVTGAAGDVRARRPAESILVFSGSTFLFASEVRLPTPSIARRYDDNRLSKTGFRFAIPPAFLDSPAEPIRIFAVIGTTATEVSLSSGETKDTEKPR